MNGTRCRVQTSEPGQAEHFLGDQMVGGGIKGWEQCTVPRVSQRQTCVSRYKLLFCFENAPQMFDVRPRMPGGGRQNKQQLR